MSFLKRQPRKWAVIYKYGSNENMYPVTAFNEREAVAKFLKNFTNTKVINVVLHKNYNNQKRHG